MGTEVLERRFAAIGARVKVVKAPPRPWGRWQPTGLLDVDTDRKGEYFELRLLGRRGIAASVVDEDRDEHCLLLLVREGGEKSKFLCGFDERHWFVAAVPESVSGVGSVEPAKAALQPDLVREAVRRVRPKDRFARRNVAFVRQGEWFFLPQWTLEVDEQDVLYDEPLTRGRGKAHILELAYRRGGETVYVDDEHPSGISPEEFDTLRLSQRRGDWVEMIRNPELYAKGAVRHPDHNTTVLHRWHRVLMNTEQGARAMRHIAFLD
jgi:hypothetical protein